MFSFRRMAVLAMTAAAALVLAPAAQGQAETAGFSYDDNLEAPNIGTFWHFEHGDIPPGSYVGGGVVTGPNAAHSGNQALQMTVANAPGSWAGWGRNVLTPAPHPGPSCHARIWVRNDTAATVHFNLEIIDPATYQYVALYQTGLEYLANWTQKSIHWNMQHQPTSTVLVRVSLLNFVKTAHIHIDDLNVTCG